MPDLNMELREVQEPERLIVGIVAPYDETTYLVRDPNGERIRRGAFAKSIRQRGNTIGLFRGHDHAKRLGVAARWEDGADGLLGAFAVNPGRAGDELLEECRDGYYPALSVGFETLGVARAVDGSTEVTEGRLREVSLVGMGAYDGAGVLAVRSAQDLGDLLKPFRARPDVNLEPIPPLVYRHR